MKRKLILCVMLIAATYAMACTNFIVGKKASADGSVFVTYNADSFGAFMPLYHYPAASHQAGDMRQIREWDTNKYLGEIPEAPETYNVVGNSNEWQVTIGETTFGGREEMADSTGIIDYGSLIYIALQRSKTAREALQVMTSLVEQYGYYSEGETFSVADKDEAWILELMGCGPDRTKSAERTVWVAVRIPDNAIAAHANQSRITKFLDGRYVQVKMKDLLGKKYAVDGKKPVPNLVVCSDNVVRYARTMGWYSGQDADFSFNAAYAAPDFSGRRYCEARVWSFFNRFADDFSEYVPYAAGIEPDAKEMPLWIIPNKLLTLQDLRDAMRDHYEGTPFALDSKGDIGGGIFGMPYRLSPLSYKIDGKEYFNERPISTFQSAFSFISQMRSTMPREVGACFWFGNDDGNMVAYTPMYSSITRLPLCFSGEGADDVTFSLDNAFWVCNWVSNMVYPRYSMLFPSLKAVRDSLDASYDQLQPEVEKKALALSSPEERVKFLTDYSCKKGDEMIARWQKLAYFLIVKYNDIVVKPTDDNGTFLRTENGLGKRVERPGYPETYARQLIDLTGTKFLVPGKDAFFPSWNKCEALTALQEFVQDVTNPSSPNFIPVEDRIATFDMDGTFVGELYPSYFEYHMLEYRVLDDPTYRDKAPEDVRQVAQAIRDFVRKGTKLPDHFDMIHGRAAAKAYAGMTLAEFDAYCKAFASKPAYGFEGMTFAQGVYRPMLEVFDYLKANGFTYYVVSGSDRFICRALAEPLGIPSNRIIGMDVKLVTNQQGEVEGVDYAMNKGEYLLRTDQLLIKNLKTNKVKQISQEIGKVPVLSFGNSGGDTSMHNYCLSNPKYRSAVFQLVADDDVRDHANREKTVPLAKRWSDAGYHVISMRDDFRTIYGENVKKVPFNFD